MRLSRSLVVSAVLGALAAVAGGWALGAGERSADGTGATAPPAFVLRDRSVPLGSLRRAAPLPALSPAKRAEHRIVSRPVGGGTGPSPLPAPPPPAPLVAPPPPPPPPPPPSETPVVGGGGT